MRRRKISFVTGARAEYGLLRPLMKRVQEDDGLELHLLVTGAHLRPEFGFTYREIKKDGFPIQEKIDILTEKDTPQGITQSMGKALEGFSQAFERLRPDILVLFGDRFEMLAAAQAALIHKIPVAHIAGGDITEGAYDESIRHCLTKLSHLHFVTNAEAESRVLQLGENPMSIFNVGSLGVDQIQTMRRLSRAKFEKTVPFQLRKKNLLVTFHSATLDETSSLKQLEELLAALERLGEEVGLIITKPNADVESHALIQKLELFAATHTHAALFDSLGQHLYFNAILHCDAVVGNSSSGLYEVPSFEKPTVNIGDRQKGRLQASSILNCEPKAKSILEAIRKALELDCSNVVNPYGKGRSTEKIFQTLKSIPHPQNLIKKKFFDQTIGVSRKPTYVIAEAGVNHNGSLELALKMIDAAADAGADAIKFQTFKADQLAVKGAKKAAYQKETTDANESQWSMLSKLELDEKAHEELWSYCQKRKIEFLSTPFDEESLDLLVGLGIKRLKVASGEITNAPLLLKVAQTGLPAILSTGMSDLGEIEQALGVLAFGFLYPGREPSSRDVFQEAFDSQKGKALLAERVTLLHCTSEYPTPYEDANLLAMDTLFKRFHLPVGLSDHTPGVSVAIAAAARGASVIEKHLTLSKALQGPDHQSSLEPDCFKELVHHLRALESAWGSGEKVPRASEVKNIPLVRKVLVAQKPIQKGDCFTRSNLTSKRFGKGTPPIYYWDLLGKPARKDYQPDEVVLCDPIT